ncbi:hypothetical protein ES705_35467 [subsurface metagenome]
MAKLKAPLLSLGASGAIGKSVVFFPWKGIDCVREYVVPSNPKSTLQIAQRGLFTDAVTLIHYAEALTGSPLGGVDKTALALYGSTEKTPRTWFNQAIARHVIAAVKGEHPQLHGDAAFDEPNPTECTLVLYNYAYPAEPGFIHWGTSKTSMPNRVACDGVGGEHTAVMTGFVKGNKYFFQFRPETVSDAKYVCRSGIYHHTQLT